MRNGKKIIVLFLFLPFKLLSQDITGLWQGTLYNDTTKQYYRYEIGISQDKKGKLSGFSHTWFLLDDMQFYGVKKLKIRKADDGKIIIEDDGLIANNYPVSPAKHVRQLNVLSFSAHNNEMMLSGPFSTNRTKQYSSLTGNVELKRKTNFRQSALVPHLQELGLDNQLSFVKEENDMLAVETQNKITEQEKKDAASAIALTANEKDRVASEKIALKNNPIQATESKTNISSGNNLAKETKTNVSIAKVNTPGNIKPSELVVTASTQKAEKQRIADSMILVNKLKKAADQQELAFAAANTKKQNIEKQRIADSVLQVKKQQDANEIALAKADEKKRKGEEIAISKLPTSTSAQKKDAAKMDSLSLVTKQIVAPALVPTAIIMANQNATTAKINTAAADVEKRTTVLQQTVTFKTDSLQLALYDNGEVDGDTVSILMNGALIMARQGLSTNAIRKTIYIDPGVDSIQLVMYAENLGTIPPNTGLLVVRDGKDMYEIRFTGDLQKNAAIVFRRQAPILPKGGL
ncbi:MAG: hypothetical protein ABIW38_02310 [Ferruginibacter sp.]